MELHKVFYMQFKRLRDRKIKENSIFCYYSGILTLSHTTLFYWCNKQTPDQGALVTQLRNKL